MIRTTWTQAASFVLPLLASATSAQELSRVLIEDPRSLELASSLDGMGFDVLEGSVSETSFELVVSPRELEHLARFDLEPLILEHGRPFSVIQDERAAAALDGGAESPPSGYPNLAQVILGLSATSQAYPNITQLVDLNVRFGLPLTADGRKIWALKISDNPDQEEDEPATLFLSGTHGREIGAVVITLDTIDRLTMGYGVDPDITRLVDENEIWVLPVSNPDGYAYVFNTNNLWRKNRRVFAQGVGVDVNRNFEFGWSSACAGSTSVEADDFKGPSAESEAETGVVAALVREQNFAKVIDYHSFGHRVAYEYGCGQHPFAGLYRNQAIELANLAGWSGRHRNPPANGLLTTWALADFASYAFLFQTLSGSFQPSHATALAEAQAVWPATYFMLDRFIDVSGRVTDFCTGEGVVASITYQGIPFVQEKNGSEPLHGRYHAWLPEGSQTLVFTAPGYQTLSRTVTVLPDAGVTLDVQMRPMIASATATTRNGSGANTNCYTTVSPPAFGGAWVATVDHGFHTGTTATAIVVHPAPSSGTFVSGGEVLVDLSSPRLLQSVRVSSGTSDTHSNPIPNDPCLGNLFAATQAVIFGGNFVLCNAEDLTSGL